MLTALACAPIAPASDLTFEQQRQILDEALAAADHGAQVRDSGSQEAREAFQTAAEKLQLLVDSGLHNGKLYYNLGNAYLETGRLGLAIVNYRRALELIPGDGRTEHNLRYARSLGRTQIEAEGQRAFLKTLFFWHYNTSIRARLTVAIVAYVLFWAMLLGRLFVRRFRWRYLLAAALVLWASSGTSVALETVWSADARGGVVTTDGVIVRKGNGERFAAQFKQKLHDGTEFDVVETHRGWLYIELSDGKRGWIRADQAELIDG